jgi:hypothetical protein
MKTVATSTVDVSTMIECWVKSGAVTATQADQMRADLSRMAETSGGAYGTGRGTSLVTEAIGYLGGVIILVASGLVTGWYWSDLSTLVRLLLAGAVTVLLLAGGASVSTRVGMATRDRLRSVLWLLASAALAGFLGLLANEEFGWRDERLACFAAAGTALTSAVLWYLHRHLLQHAATFVPVAVAVGTGTWLLARSGDLPAAAVWVVGAAWAALAFGGVLRPAQQGRFFGAAAMVFASITVVAENWGTALALFTVTALVVIAVLVRDLLLLAVAAVGVLLVLPPIMGRLFPGVLAAALALMAVGVLLVGAAVVTARRRHDTPRRPRPPALPTTLATRH